jgi:hypothetical protein
MFLSKSVVTSCILCYSVGLSLPSELLRMVTVATEACGAILTN